MKPVYCSSEPIYSKKGHLCFQKSISKYSQGSKQNKRSEYEVNGGKEAIKSKCKIVVPQCLNLANGKPKFIKYKKKVAIVNLTEMLDCFMNSGDLKGDSIIMPNLSISTQSSTISISRNNLIRDDDFQLDTGKKTGSVLKDKLYFRQFSSSGLADLFAQ